VTYPLDRVSFGAGTPRPLDAQIASQDASRRALSCSAMIKVNSRSGVVGGRATNVTIIRLGRTAMFSSRCSQRSSW
jgi:hypothetical protein